MKNFKLMAIALVAMFGFAACDKDCDHDFIEYDYSEALIGTWTYIAEDGLAEAMVINPDGSFEVTGVMKGGSLYEEKGTIKVVNNKVSLVFEGDKDVIEGRLELVAGKSLSIVLNEEYDIRLTYDYCANDLSEEIVGMWVCTETPSAEENDMLIMTYNADGTTLFTGYSYEADVFSNNVEASYMVIGDLLIHKQPDIAVEYGLAQYNALKMKYTPNATALGDVKTLQAYAKVGENYVETSTTWLRVKQSLDLTGKTYDYSTAYISNAKGKDVDFTILNGTFNIANINASDFDVILGSGLYCVELNANSIKHKSRPYGEDVEVVTPITVDGNKVTLDFSTLYPALRKVDMYMFQDANDSQLHMYMHTNAFINYFANLEVMSLLKYGEIAPTDAAAVEKVFADMEARVESINVSFVMKARK